MDEAIRTAAISPLRQRLIDDMNMRRFSRETQRNYIRDVGHFAIAWVDAYEQLGREWLAAHIAAFIEIGCRAAGDRDDATTWPIGIGDEAFI